MDISNAFNATIYDNLNFNFIRDIAPVSGSFQGAAVLVVHPSLPAKSVPELITYGKANPGMINIASGGIGSIPRVNGGLFKMLAGVNMVHVPYRGVGPALTDLLAGQMQVMFPGMSAAIEYIKAGKLRALAVTSAVRLNALPNVPTVGEFVPGYEAIGWFGFGAPKNTPTEIIDRLNKEINACLAEPRVQTRFAELGGAVLPGSSAAFGKFIADETEKWGKVIRTAGIQPD